MTITYRPEDPFPQDGFIATDEVQFEDQYDGLKVLVLGQYAAERYQPKTGEEVCISITAKHDLAFGYGNAKLSGMFRDVLCLNFDDVAVGSAEHETAESITPEQAKQVAEFANKHRNMKTLVVHCFAGMSRSRSMASAIADYFDLPYSFTVLNPHVYDSVVDALTAYEFSTRDDA